MNDNMIYLDNYKKFIHISYEIRRLGFIIFGHFDQRSFIDAYNAYRLQIDEKINIILKESNFYQTISISFIENGISYDLKVNKLTQKFTKSEKHTQESYGKVYKIKVTEILDLLNLHLNGLNYENAFNNLIANTFNTVFERVLPGFSSLAYLKKNISQKEMRPLIIEKTNVIKEHSNKIKIEIFEDELIDFEGNHIGFNDMISMIDKSPSFIFKKNISKEILNLDMELKLFDNNIYLVFDEIKKLKNWL